MYQVPIVSIEKIRKTRRKVKNILSEFGLEDCQNLLKDLRENPEENSDENETVDDTEWVDFTDGFNGKQKKKWPYRTRALCCSLCKYSTRNIYSFKSHVNRSHEYERAKCALQPCSECQFVGHPRALKKHMLFFHTPVASARTTTQAVPIAPPTHRIDERYQCSRCGYPSSSIYIIKKHIIFKHLDHLARQFIGHRAQANGGKSYFCKVCKMSTGMSLDYMLHHMLVEPIHYWVNAQVQSLISENKHIMKQTPNGNGLFVTFPGLAPKPQQPQAISNGRLVLSNNGQPPGTMLTLQQLQGAPSGTTLICAPGTNQAFLPPQASALVQLASAEAKGLLQPGAAISLQSALPRGPPMVQLPTISNAPLKPVPLALASAPTLGQPPQNPQVNKVFLPPRVQVTMAGLARSGSQPVVFTTAVTNQTTPQGTMLTSQSLLNHLIPTGNKVNGMPTYTFAPLNVTMSNGQSSATPQPVKPASISSPQTKKWTTCPLCNELFPSNVFDMHTEVAHRTKSLTSRHESVAARAPFLRKMPDKTVKCLMCKVLLSSKGLFEHLLHGLSCLYCSALFYSIKQLIEHVKSHNPSNKAYCDFLRQEYRVYTNGGKLLFPYFDINTTAPKEILGDTELNLALVTNSLDLIFLKMLPSSHLDICKTPSKINSAYCPFCDETFQNEAKHLQHLKQKHFVAPTIHAILKTEAFKCIYCNGVYTGKVTQQAVKLHIQRCRCSPKKQAEASKVQESHDLKVRGQPQLTLKPPQPQINQSPGFYFLQMPQARPTIPTQTLSLTRAPAHAPVPIRQPPVEPPETEAELQSKKRLEAAWKEVVDANKREREERLAMRKKREQERLAAAPPPPPEVPSDPIVKLVLEPSTTERRCAEERRDFISRYFHINPYITKKETDELCKKLSLSKAELAAHFGNKRTKCMRSIQKNNAAVLLGFNMTELSKLKHNLLIPDVQPAEPPEQTDMPTTEPEPMEKSGDSEKIIDAEQMEENQDSEEIVESETGNEDADETNADADATVNVDVSEKVAEMAEA